MTLDLARRRPDKRWTATALATLVCSIASLAAALPLLAQSDSAARKPVDLRVGLRAGLTDAGEAARNLELIAHRSKPEGFFNPASAGDFAFANSDLAFSGHYAFQGGYNGFQVWDISDPSNPTVRTALQCPGGQGDPSVYQNLLFISVEQTSGRIDCGKQGVAYFDRGPMSEKELASRATGRHGSRATSRRRSS